MADVAVIGLGAMGGGMARAARTAGLGVVGIDVDPGREAEFRAGGGLAREALPRVSAVAVVTLTGAQAEDALFGAAGAAGALAPGTVVLSCATMAPEQARALAARLAAAGLAFLDAPISGGAAKAEAGALSVMASGSAEAFAKARPLLDATAETVFDLGTEPGAGSAMKAVNQLLAGVHIAAMAEAVVFAAAQGIAPETVLEVIPRCAGTSWMFENRAPHVVEADYAPRSAVAIWPKDLGIVLDAARAAGAPVPLASAALARFTEAAGAGLAREDDAAVAKVYARGAGVTLPGEGS